MCGLAGRGCTWRAPNGSRCLVLAPRSREGAKSLGVLAALRGTLVHDALALYEGFPDADHQLCVAHYAKFRVMWSSWFMCRSVGVDGLELVASPAS